MPGLLQKTEGKPGHRIQLCRYSAVVGVQIRFDTEVLAAIAAFKDGRPVDNEIQVGEERIDSRFIIHADQPDVAKAFLTNAQVVEAITHMEKVDRLEVYRGSLKAIVLDPQLAGLNARDVDWIFDVLARFKALYEGQLLAMKILHTGPSKTICPFCARVFSATRNDCHLHGLRRPASPGMLARKPPVHNVGLRVQPVHSL